MSRKKSSKQTFFSPLGLRVGEVEEDSGLQRKDFAKKLGFTPAYLAQLIKGQRKNPSVRFLGAVEREFGVNRAWLESGEGLKYRKETEKPPPPSIKRGAGFGGHRGVDELVELARSILLSNTDQAQALAAQIRTFNEVIDLKKRVAALEKSCKTESWEAANFEASDKKKVM